MKKVLIIFAKEPKAGRVKTRLAKKISPEKARDVYEAFLKDTVKNVREGADAYDIKIVLTPESSTESVKELLGFDDIEHQKGDTLTERLSNAFSDSFSKGYDRVIAIGSDSPMIGDEVIISAMDALSDHDCVIGPATDGGYYLIGLTRHDHEIFSGISWSTEKVFPQTLEKLKDVGYSYFVMDKLPDVDDLCDLMELKDMCDGLRDLKEKERLAHTVESLKNGLAP